MSKRILIIGIDSMDSILLERYYEFMPSFKKLKTESPTIKMHSVFPPDSDTAWASIYTGLNPANHGLVNFLDPIEKSIKIQTQESESDYVSGKTFWDVASQHGIKNLLLFPHITYPTWKINGIMVSRSRIGQPIKMYPESLNISSLSNLQAPVGVPKKTKANLSRLLIGYRNLLMNEEKFFIEMMKKNDWDICFCYSSILDAIQHYFWDINKQKYFDPVFGEVIKEFYIRYDQLITKLIETVDDDTCIIVLSDHGHTSRPEQLININEILRINGYLKRTKRSIKKSSADLFRKKTIEWISKYDLGWFASKIIRILPGVKGNFSSSALIDFNSSSAYATDLSGIKAYTYGGIKINNVVVNPDNYEEMRERIINVLKTNLEGKYQWIVKREELYKGGNILKYPDILIQLKEGYGIGNLINSPIISRAYSSQIVPGSHRGDTPIFFIKNQKRQIKNYEISLMDIAPSILDLLEINYEESGLDGVSIFSK
jgi:predicted AlkP superfamily phosphohydrolase/phosphomutase